MRCTDWCTGVRGAWARATVVWIVKVQECTIIGKFIKAQHSTKCQSQQWEYLFAPLRLPAIIQTMYRSSMWSLGDAHFVDLPSIQCHRNDMRSYRFDATDHELNRTIICYKLNHCIEDDDFTLGVCIRCFPARRQFEQCFSYFDTGYAMLKKLCKAPTPINRRFTKEWESVLEASGFPLDKYSLLRFIYSAPCVPNQLSQAARRMPATGCYYENNLATHPYTESIRSTHHESNKE